MENKVKITLLANGPSMLEAEEIRVVYPDGREEVKTQKVFLCRCGHSKNKPFCDGQHKPNNFAG